MRCRKSVSRSAGGHAGARCALFVEAFRPVKGAVRRCIQIDPAPYRALLTPPLTRLPSAKKSAPTAYAILVADNAIAPQTNDDAKAAPIWRPGPGRCRAHQPELTRITSPITGTHRRLHGHGRRAGDGAATHRPYHACSTPRSHLCRCRPVQRRTGGAEGRAVQAGNVESSAPVTARQTCLANWMTAASIRQEGKLCAFTDGATWTPPPGSVAAALPSSLIPTACCSPTFRCAPPSASRA